MAKDKINDTTFSIILQIHKNFNWNDVDSIYKQITKTVDFENISKEFLDNRIYNLIPDGKFIDKINRKTDSYYVNEKEIDVESLNASPITPDKSFYIPTFPF